MAYTALDLITASLKRLGVLSGIETPTADLAQDALDRLNGLLETWSTESLNIWTQVRQVVTPVVANKASYTIGTGGDIDTARPPWIDGAALVLPGPPVYESPLLLLTQDDWQQERVKGLTSTFPTALRYQPDYPLGQLFPWPVYSGGSVSALALYLPQAISSVLLLTTPLSLPPGYRRALRDELAVELAPELGRQAGDLLRLANEAHAQLKRVNFVPHVLHTPIALGGCAAYDWRVDE